MIAQKSYLVLGSITNQSLRFSESNVAGCGTVALVVGNDLHFAMLKHSHTRVRCAQIDSDRWSCRHCTVYPTTNTCQHSYSDLLVKSNDRETTL